MKCCVGSVLLIYDFTQVKRFKLFSDFLNKLIIILGGFIVNLSALNCGILVKSLL